MKNKRKTEDDKIESLEKQIRDLKSEKRSLEKRLKKISRGYKSYLDRDEPLDVPKQEAEKVCFSCGTGKLIKITVLNRSWQECDHPGCNKRTKTKITL